MVAEDGSKLTHDVWLVLPVVLDEHCREVLSVRSVVRREWRESVSGSNIDLANTVHGIHLDFEVTDSIY